eukprot:CAMPEP_0204514238 /NCGR_PEP_ID=MMETSP0661-20131031/1956_1 /ASSEMBLY_ACC=CAM_ASM_000606 /TAXON_ID=109239 /ORGANISM="Alexandrium margalefi, Strain AMGDE01CS-322" /LENGTH=68 /DNA_ID=CAMNT_0051519475 /DNA_START=134 /DNA_END=341 /DNA_ORIENTATION=-
MSQAGGLPGMNGLAGTSAIEMNHKGLTTAKRGYTKASGPASQAGGKESGRVCKQGRGDPGHTPHHPLG